MADGQVQLAHESVDEAIEAAAKLSELNWLLFLRAFKIQIYLWEGSVAQAKKEIILLHIPKNDMPTYSRELEYITLVRLLSKQHKYSEALRLLERLKPQSARECQLSSIVEISILQALIEHQRGQKSAALRYIHEALIIGEANGYVRSFLDEGSMMAELLQLYVQHRSHTIHSSELKEVSATYVRKLIGLFTQKKEMNAPSPASALVEPITPSELNMLYLIRDGASNKQIAEELALSEGTVRVYLSRIYAKLGVTPAVRPGMQHKSCSCCGKNKIRK
ncbi:DNA-binding NarL/FixJ family response regulator [Paenibacillus eucommiae]|uniref:DNA-binding NarL/FixJ family response regulator n=2 Tax=Paenibacillus eucommiae TaxID=1355755 RepID=A0ABS4IW57_9BACL|nr:DNA-binding NarL/FixJ family response regulator [Paenibacillus eucommiae]